MFSKLGLAVLSLVALEACSGAPEPTVVTVDATDTVASPADALDVAEGLEAAPGAQTFEDPANLTLRRHLRLKGSEITPNGNEPPPEVLDVARLPK